MVLSAKFKMELKELEAKGVVVETIAYNVRDASKKTGSFSMSHDSSENEDKKPDQVALEQAPALEDGSVEQDM